MSRSADTCDWHELGWNLLLGEERKAEMKEELKEMEMKEGEDRQMEEMEEAEEESSPRHCATP